MFSKTTALLLLSTSIGFVVAAQVLVKARFLAAALHKSSQRSLVETAQVAITDPLLWLALLILLFGALFWYVALTKLPLSFMMSAAAMVVPLSALGAHFFLDDAFTLQKAAAMLVITSGVIWLAQQLD